MSSLYTRTVRSVRARQGKEAFNSRLTSRNANYDAFYDLTWQYEEQIKKLLGKFDQLQNSLQGLSIFSGEFDSLVESLIAGSETHVSLTRDSGEVHGNLSILYADSVRFNQAAQIFEARSELTDLLGKFDRLRVFKTEQKKCRLVYDHYTQKVSKMKALADRKKEANPYYEVGPKKAERMVRNDRKLRSATEDFNAASTKTVELMEELFESRFSVVVPLVAKLVELEVMTMKKSGSLLRALEEWGDDLIKANGKRASIEKAEGKAKETESLLREHSEERKEEVYSQAAKNEIFTTEVDEESLVFDVERLKVLEPESQKPFFDDMGSDDDQMLQREQRASLSSSQPVLPQSQLFPIDVPLEPAVTNPYTDSNPGSPSNPFSQSDQFFISPGPAQFFNELDPQLSNTRPNDLGTLHMAQMQQWMSMMQNPEFFKQMQREFLTEPPSTPDPFAGADQAPPSEPKQPSRNPFTQPTASNFFDLF